MGEGPVFVSGTKKMRLSAWRATYVNIFREEAGYFSSFPSACLLCRQHEGGTIIPIINKGLLKHLDTKIHGMYSLQGMCYADKLSVLDTMDKVTEE